MPTETIPFHTFGYFEEITDAVTLKFIGTRKVTYEKEPILGQPGRQDHIFRAGEIIVLDAAHKGTKTHRFKKDTRVWITTHALCGRMKK